MERVLKRGFFYNRWIYGDYSKGRKDVYVTFYIFFYPQDKWKVKQIHLEYTSAVPSLKYGARVDDDEIVCVDDSEVVRKAKANKPSEAEMLQRELKSLLQEGMKVFSD